jgi:hypothetical protein
MILDSFSDVVETGSAASGFSAAVSTLLSVFFLAIFPSLWV